MITIVIEIILQAIAAFLIGTVIFDIFHCLFHTFFESKHKLLRAIGSLHMKHHRFYTPTLKIKKEWAKLNFLNHLLIEYLIQMSVILTCIFFFHPMAILIATILETGIFIGVCYCRGVDAHHKPYGTLPSFRGGLFVSAEYHALHHIHPSKFFSSNIKLLDYILGTGHHLKGKKIAMTGASGALGSNMKRLLEKEGAKVICFKYGVDYTYDNYENLKNPLATADILFLCHGSKYENAQQANCDSFISMIELFKSVRTRELLPLEVWGVGSEIEFHPCFGMRKLKVYASSKRNYARQARIYFHDRDIQYRHLVHSAFTSPMGTGLITASFAAKITLFFIKRGFKYIPVSYTGFAFLNYFRFLFKK